MKIRNFAVAFMLVAALICGSSCSSGIKSSDEDVRIVGTCGGYDIKYEELRFITLTCKTELEEKYGDNIFSPTSSFYNEDYYEELERLVEEQICQNYASVIEFKENKIKTSDRETKKYVEQYVDAVMELFDSEEEYVAYLDECFLTDSVLRFNMALESCFYRYYEKLAEELDREAYDAVMSADGFIRTVSIFIKNDEGESVEQNKADAERIYNEIMDGAELSDYIGTKYNQDTGACDYYFVKGYYKEEYENAAFALDIGEVSPVVETAEGFYIIQRMELDEAYMLDNIETLKSIYLECKAYENINKRAGELVFELNDFGKTLSLWSME